MRAPPVSRPSVIAPIKFPRLATGLTLPQNAAAMGRIINESSLPRLPEPATRDDLLRLLIERDNPVILDIGANEGQSATAFLKLFPAAAVHAFEPSPETFKTLCENLSGNSNVTLNQLAVGESAGQASFYQTSVNQMDSLLSLAEDGLYAQKNITTTGTVEVDVSTLDAYAQANNLEKIDFCKIDTQGCSGKVLKGARGLLEAGTIGILQVEILFSRYYESQETFGVIESLLFPHGYRFHTLLDTDTHRVGRSYLNPRTGETQHVDAIYIHRDYVSFE